MDDLSDCFSTIMEFKPSGSKEKEVKLTNSSTGTDSLPTSKHVAVATDDMRPEETQTIVETAKTAPVDDHKLAIWLRKIYPSIAAELDSGVTPLPTNSKAFFRQLTSADHPKIQLYQQISMGTLEQCQGLAIWLSVHISNAPVLVATTAPSPHGDWCEHANQSLKIFMPKYAHTGNFVMFTEVKSVPVKACLKCLCTNSNNKNVFSGSTLDGDIYVWKFEHNSNRSQVDVHELFNIISPHGIAVAMDWSAEDRLLTCHANGWVMQWIVGNQLLKEWEQLITPTQDAAIELTAIVSMSATDFVVGAKDGGVYYCWQPSTVGNTMKRQIEMRPLKRHKSTVSSLQRAIVSAQTIVISCDLSGQIHYHDLLNTAECTNAQPHEVLKVPLPFKNAIACSPNAETIYCPGSDGSLECFRLRDGMRSVVVGVLGGKGNFIKCSDNGVWVVTGLYGDFLQIFYVDE